MRRLILLMAVMGATVLLASGVAYALSVQCDGTGDQDPDPGQCSGTPDPDAITGTQLADLIEALAGNDRVDAFQGNDTVRGGPDGDGGAAGLPFADFAGETNLEGAEDSDTVYGQGGNDNIDADQNDTPGSLDRSLGGNGNDRILAVDGNEDFVNCGKGTADVARIDNGIDSAQNCETVRRV